MFVEVVFDLGQFFSNGLHLQAVLVGDPYVVLSSKSCVLKPSTEAYYGPLCRSLPYCVAPASVGIAAAILLPEPCLLRLAPESFPEAFRFYVRRDEERSSHQIAL